MDENKIIEAIKKVLENDELDIRDLLTYEERIETQSKYTKYFKNKEYEKVKYKLFTKDEAEVYDELSQLSPAKRRYIEYDIHLSDKRKLEILKETKNTPLYNYTELIKHIENDDYKTEALKYILDNSADYYFIKYEEIILSFKNIDAALEVLDEALEKNPEKKYSIIGLNFKIEMIFKTLKKEQYIKVLELMDKYNFIQEFKVLNNIENKIEIFEEIIKLPNFKKEHVNLHTLINNLNENDSFKAFDLLIENEYENIKNIEIVQLIKKTSKDRKKEFIDKLYIEIDLNNLEIILSNYIQTIPKQERRKEFREYIINDDRFDSLKIAGYLAKETMLNCIDEVLITKDKEIENDIEKKKTVTRIIEYFENLNHDIECNKEEVNCDTLIKLISKYEELNEKNLKEIINKFGYQILKYINSENIRELINSNNQDLDKILCMFNEKNLTIDAHKKDSIIESVVQREFMFFESESYNIFSIMEEQLAKNDTNLKDIFDRVIETVFNKRPKKLQIICTSNNITIEELFQNIKNGKSLDILHQITQQYIEIQREEYSKIRTPEFIKLLDLDKVFKKEWIQKKYIQVKDTNTIKNKIKIVTNNLTEDQEKLIGNNEQLEYIIEFKKNPTEEILKKIERKNLKVFNEILNILYEKEQLNDIPEEEKENAEYIYSFKKVKSDYLIEILSQIDIKCIKEKLLTSEETYRTLLEILNKHKYLGFGQTFYPVIDDIDLNIGSQAIAGFINCFYKLYNEYECTGEKQKKFIENHTMTKLLEEGYCHEITSNKYAILIGDEDFKLIFSNTGTNRASSTVQVRLNNILEVIPKMYDKHYLTIPPINETITLKNGKQIKIEIGQPLDFTNLTVGERTNACLRSKGAFRDLWEFILTNKNGFNIIFKTPTDKFISRVSGIRNGNTIFENELRNSVLKEYTNEDLIEVNQIVTQLLENYTRKSEYPIENILITSDYAMEKEKEKLKQITTNRKEAMYGLNFNYENSDNFKGIVLSNNGELKEIKLGKNETELYTINKNIKTYYKEDAIKKIKQLHAINQLLNGVPIEDIEINDQEYDIESISCISNNQYYILKYKEEIIDTFVLDKYRQNEEVLNDINNRLELKNENSRSYH